jgi:flavin-binding protein dodecin
MPLQIVGDSPESIEEPIDNHIDELEEETTEFFNRSSLKEN